LIWQYWSAGSITRTGKYTHDARGGGRCSCGAGSKRLLPVHWGKFVLALHAWDEPIERLVKAAAGKDFALMTPGWGSILGWEM